MSSLKVVTADLSLKNDPVMERLFDEAMQSSPLAQHDDSIMSSRKPITGKCALCGNTAVLTKEHIPPKASGNKQNTTKHTPDDWINSQDIKNLPSSSKVQQGGIFWVYHMSLLQLAYRQ